MSSSIELITDTYSGSLFTSEPTNYHDSLMLRLPSSVESTYLPYEEWINLKKNDIKQDITSVPVSVTASTTAYTAAHNSSGTTDTVPSILLATSSIEYANFIDSGTDSFIITPPTNLYSNKHSTHQTISYKTADNLNYNSTQFQYDNNTIVNTHYYNNTFTSVDATIISRNHANLTLGTFTRNDENKSSAYTKTKSTPNTRSKSATAADYKSSNLGNNLRMNKNNSNNILLLTIISLLL